MSNAATVTQQIEYLDMQSTELNKPSFLKRILNGLFELVKSNWKTVLFFAIGNVVVYLAYKKIVNNFKN